MADLALAREAVACPRWRWMAGMLAFLPALHEDRGLRYRVPDGPTLIDAAPHDGWFPDLNDPATLGCLLALVREAWGCPTVYVRWSALEGIWICMIKGYPPHAADSEAAALVAALLAAP